MAPIWPAPKKSSGIKLNFRSHVRKMKDSKTDSSDGTIGKKSTGITLHFRNHIAKTKGIK